MIVDDGEREIVHPPESVYGTQVGVAGALGVGDVVARQFCRGMTAAAGVVFIVGV